METENGIGNGNREAHPLTESHTPHRARAGAVQPVFPIACRMGGGKSGNGLVSRRRSRNETRNLNQAIKAPVDVISQPVA